MTITAAVAMTATFNWHIGSGADTWGRITHEGKRIEPVMPCLTPRSEAMQSAWTLVRTVLECLTHPPLLPFKAVALPNHIIPLVLEIGSGTQLAPITICAIQPRSN